MSVVVISRAGFVMIAMADVKDRLANKRLFRSISSAFLGMGMSMVFLYRLTGRFPVSEEPEARFRDRV